MKLKFFIPFLCLMIAGAVSASAAETTNHQNAVRTPAIEHVGAEKFAKLLTDGNPVVLDVRTPHEFSSGHIKNAINMDLHSPDFETSLAKLDKSKTYLVYCSGGARSSLACRKMKQLGFPKLIDLVGGFSKWRQAKEPIEK